MTLTIELEAKTKALRAQDISEVAICCDKEGLAFLIEKLESLRNGPDHCHLMTPSWAGTDLTETKQGGDDYVLVNHLRIVRM